MSFNRLVIALVVAGGLIGSSLIGIFAKGGPHVARRATSISVVGFVLSTCSVLLAALGRGPLRPAVDRSSHVPRERTSGRRVGRGASVGACRPPCSLAASPRRSLERQLASDGFEVVARQPRRGRADRPRAAAERRRTAGCSRAARGPRPAGDRARRARDRRGRRVRALERGADDCSRGRSPTRSCSRGSARCCGASPRAARAARGGRAARSTARRGASSSRGERGRALGEGVRAARQARLRPGPRVHAGAAAARGLGLPHARPDADAGVARVARAPQARPRRRPAGSWSTCGASATSCATKSLFR